MVFFRQIDADPLPEGRGILTDIDHNVEHCPAHYPDQLALRLLYLVVQATEDPFGGARVVILLELDASARVLSKCVLVEAFKKKASRISKNLGFDNEDIRNFRWRSLHWQAVLRLVESKLIAGKRLRLDAKIFPQARFSHARDRSSRRLIIERPIRCQSGQNFQRNVPLSITVAQFLSETRSITTSPMTVYIYGAGGLGREVLATLQAGKALVSCFIVDPGFPSSDIHGVAVRAASLDSIQDPEARFVLAVGDGRARQRAAFALRHHGGFFTPLHPSATIGPHVSIAQGAMVIGPVSVTTDVSVGAHTLVNPGCTIAHDCVLGAFVNLGPSVSLAGRVTVQEGANLGVGVSVAPGIVIGAWATVGAGAVVIRDVEPGSTVVGVPARLIRRGSIGAPFSPPPA